MVRLVKGAKLTYGWVVVSSGREIPIPPDAWEAYGFQPGVEAVFLRGSKTSGGFSISTPALMKAARVRSGGVRLAEIACGQFGDMQVRLPLEVGFTSGDRLLTVHGSCNGLGFVARGRIYGEALRHPEVSVYQLDAGEPAAEEAAAEAV